ncbi:MAG: hypothetical protein JWL97_3427 [Gemmatimonadales bacterium]|nr:hypothetical protein [Gemmatimonadales bacterium]
MMDQSPDRAPTGTAIWAGQVRCEFVSPNQIGSPASFRPPSAVMTWRRNAIRGFSTHPRRPVFSVSPR